MAVQIRMDLQRVTNKSFASVTHHWLRQSKRSSMNTATFAHKLPNIFKQGMDFAKIKWTSIVFKIGTLHSAAFPVALDWG